MAGGVTMVEKIDLEREREEELFEKVYRLVFD